MVKRDVLGVLMVPINDEQAIESARIIIDYNDDLSSKPLGQDNDFNFKRKLLKQKTPNSLFSAQCFQAKL